MSDVPFIPDGWVTALVIVKGLLALVALLLTLVNMIFIWRFPALVGSPSRRHRMYALLAASLLICWGSSDQITALGKNPPTFTLSYQHLFSIGVCLLLSFAQASTFREDVQAQRRLRAARQEQDAQATSI